MENVKIRAIIDGNIIVAKTNYLTIADMGISLVEPHFNTCAGSCHIPYFALPKHQYCNSDGQLTEYGKNMADDLIKKLYQNYLLVKRNLGRINQILPSIINQLESAEGKYRSDLEILYEQRRNLKTEFKSNLLNSKEYQQAVGPINRKIEELKYSFSNTKEKIVQKAVKGIFGETNDCILKNYFQNLIEDNLK